MPEPATYFMKAREIALLALQETESKGTKSEQSLHRLLETHKPGNNDSALATELVNGVLRFRLRLDFLLGLYYHHDLGKAAPVLRNILRLGAYQLLFLDKIPGWAAVDECVKLARKYKGRHLAGVVNGVLRKVALEKISLDDVLKQEALSKRLSIQHSHPEWLVSRWLAYFSEERTVEMLRANNLPPLMSFRVNTLKTEPAAVLQALRDASVSCRSIRPEEFIVTRNFNAVEPFVHEGLVTVQNPTQALPCFLLHPQPGESVLDLCAAPGGKATFLAELMQNRGRILAVDRYPNKCEKIICRAQTLGISIIETVSEDARTARTGAPPDAVLLDAPCTGTGVFGRKPEIRWRVTPEKLDELVRLQAELLDHAATLLKPGGVLVYATCSVEPEENRLQINGFLERNPGFAREDAPAALPSVYSAAELAPGSFLTLPGMNEGFDGGFAQRLVKKSTA